MIRHAPPHPLAWAAPRPLWRGMASPDLAPTILRFASDSFMEQLLAVLEQDPGRLADHVVRPEFWRVPMTNPVDHTDRVPLPAPMKAARRAQRLAMAARRPATATATAVSTSAGAATVAVETAEERQPLKLYQPAHQRYYIACATLACAIPGLPDRRLAGGHEQLGMVLRRLLPAPTSGSGEAPVEYAYITAASGSRWQRVSDDQTDAVLAPGEELLPVFPLAHADSGARQRVMWGGLIPVARREAYLGASVNTNAQRLVDGQREALGTRTSAEPSVSTLARSSEFRMDVIEPWKALISSALASAANIRADDAATPAQRLERVREANLRLQMQSWLVLTDLARVLGDHLKPVADAIANSSGAALSGRQRELFDHLSRNLTTSDAAALALGLRPAGASSDGRPYRASIAAALRDLTPAVIANLEAATTVYDGATGGPWPGFHALLAGVSTDAVASKTSIAAQGPFRFTATLGLPDPEDQLLAPASTTDFDLNHLERLATLFGRCLTPEVEATARPMPYAQQLAQTMASTVNDKGVFCLRFVHLNEDCGPLHPPTLSAPSATFELAAFFDADAPARPLRISLPLDVSPAGLRKHSRGTAFVLSDMLCGQVQRAKRLGLIDLIRHVLPWPLHKQLDIGNGEGCRNGRDIDIGMICSLSIPIITICALILLIIIVSLLDFIFRWLPWFVLCFPVPQLKAKGGGS